jgi:hypothetical protein
MKDNLYNNLSSIPSEDLRNGFSFNSGSRGYTCLFCGRFFEQGVIYNADDRQVEARLAAAHHVEKEHKGVFVSLLGMGPERTGLSGIQEIVLKGVYDGKSDREIAADLGGKTESTVRNHRFQLRKRMKEARIFVALMEIIETRGSSSGFVDFNADIPAQDDSVIVTVDENEAILRKYFSEDGRLRLRGLPKKQKAKLVVLNRLAELFQRDRQYTEAEIDTTLIKAGDASGEIRRYLVDYGFLARKRDGSAYWRP